jgi:F0F1-type ATP synthase assembly protein I
MSDGAGGGYRYLATATWFLGMGWTIAIAILLGVLAGNWLDGQTGRHPLFVLAGILLGLAAGLYSAGRMLMRFLAGQGG